MEEIEFNPLFLNILICAQESKYDIDTWENDMVILTNGEKYIRIQWKAETTYFYTNEGKIAGMTFDELEMVTTIFYYYVLFKDFNRD